MVLQADSDHFSEAPESRQELENELKNTQTGAYAKGTLKNLVCQWRSFLRFCRKYKIRQWPVKEHTLCLFAQFLAFSFHSQKSVRNYLSGVRTLHVLAKVHPPDLKDIEIRLTLRGLARKMARPVKRAQPLTPEILLDILPHLNLNRRKDLVFWGLLLVGFFSMLRKSNLVPDTVHGFDPAKQLTRGHIEFREGFAIVKITWAKNLQNQQRVVQVPLFAIDNSPLCPVRALRALLQTPGRKHHPLFGTGNKISFTYNQFQTKFRNLLKKAGYRPKAFSSHSIRRGSVNFAYRSGIPESLIAVHGDWCSDAYKTYLSYPLEVRAVVSLKMREAILKRGW